MGKKVTIRTFDAQPKENRPMSTFTAETTRPRLDDETGRHQRNGHTLGLDGCMWRCLQCRHVFDAAVDAELFWCGDDCASKHPGD